MTGYNLSDDNFRPTRVGAISLAGVNNVPARRKRRNGPALTIGLALAAVVVLYFGCRMAGV